MRTLASVVLVTTVFLAGCGAAAAPAGSGPVTATVSAAPQVSASPAVSTAPPVEPTGTPATAEPTETPAPIPLAEIVTGDATIPGTVGSYTVDGRGSDGPWLPFGSLPSVGLASRETSTIQFTDNTPIGDIQVLIASALDTSGASTHGVASTRLSADGRSTAIGPLPVGRWVIAARLFRADGRGDGTTYWAVTVE